MAIAGQKCWITAGSIPLTEAAVVDLNENAAQIILSEPTALPPECSLFFTYNCTVGRKCKVTRQMATHVSLSFLGRIGPPELVPTNVVNID